MAGTVSSIPTLSGYDIPSTSEALPQNKVDWTVDPTRAALLIHDMQEYFLSFWGLDSQFVAQLVAKIKLLRAACKAVGIPVYYTAQPINQTAEDRALLNDMWGAGIDKCPELQPIHSALKPEEDDIELTKWRYSAFKRSCLQESLKEKKRDQLIICGVYAHIGCLATGMDAFMEDIQPFFAADALGDFSLEQHTTAVKSFATNCGSVILTSTLVNSFVQWDLKRVVAELVEDDDEELPEADDNLIDYGLDSIKIMALASRWQYFNPKVDFVALSQDPTVDSWSKLLQV